MAPAKRRDGARATSGLLSLLWCELTEVSKIRFSAHLAASSYNEAAKKADGLASKLRVAPVVSDRYSSVVEGSQVLMPARKSWFDGVFQSRVSPICVKCTDKTFFGTVFVRQKTCVAKVDCWRLSRVYGFLALAMH